MLEVCALASLEEENDSQTRGAERKEGKRGECVSMIVCVRVFVYVCVHVCMFVCVYVRVSE